MITGLATTQIMSKLLQNEKSCAFHEILLGNDPVHTDLLRDPQTHQNLIPQPF